MANTTIQLKYSLVTANPPSLNIGEPAYSYTSNTLFIGSPAGTGAIAIGGKFYLDQQSDIYAKVNAAFNAANSAGSSAFAQGAYNHANAAFNKANTNASDIAVIQGIDLTQNTNITNAQNKADAAYNWANTVYSNYAYPAYVNTLDLAAVNLTQNTNITTAQNKADAAFVRANNSLNANAGGVITGPVTVAANLTITGNLTVIGNTVTTNIESLNIADPLIYLAANNYSGDAVEIGFAANYYDGAAQRHAGVFREASNKEFYVFDNYTPEPTANLIDINDVSFRVATLNANLKSQLITLNGQNLQTYVNDAFNKANAAYNQANTTQTFASEAFHKANASYNLANTNATNITSLEGVNVTQNTNITNAQNKADASFIHANAAFDKANTDVTSISTVAGNYGIVTGGYAYVPGFKLEANGRISQANATLLQVDTSMITSGVFTVERGGTGAATHTLNGVLLGQGTNALTTASSSTEGHVLTINNSGVPTFSHLSGGTF